MKIYICADIEGVCGISHWEEAGPGKEGYKIFSDQMTAEVKAACDGASSAGAKEIWVQDAHGSGRNMNVSILPENVKLIRGWGPHPYLMLQEIDKTFDAVIMIGFHSCGGSGGNPLSHTISNELINHIRINEKSASEFLIHSYIATTMNIPVVFLSGDYSLCKEVKDLNNNIETVSVNKGRGSSVLSIHPKLAVKLIEEGVKKALEKDRSKCKIKLPEKFKVEMCYKKHTKAYWNSFYPGMKQVSDTDLLFETSSFLDVMKMFLFTIFC